MAEQLQLRRGTTAENDAFTGAVGEVTVDTTTNELRVHDGVTAGGTTVGGGGALDAFLTSIAALGTAADKMIYTTAVDTAAETALTAAARTVLDDASVSAMVDTLGGSASTGTGGLVRETSPNLVTPRIGTPASGTLTNCTGLPTAGLVDDAVTYAKLQNVSATDMVLGRSTAGAGNAEEIPCTAAGRALLDDANAAAQVTTLGLTKVYRSTQYMLVSASTTLTDCPAAHTFFAGSNGHIARLDTTGHTQIRLHARVTTAGAAGTKLRLRYYTSFTTTIGNYLQIGTSEVDVGLDATGATVSSWIDLAAGAIGDIFVTLTTIDGDGAGDPVARWIWAELRGYVYQ